MKLPIILPLVGKLVDLRKMFTIFGAGWHRTVAQTMHRDLLSITSVGYLMKLPIILPLVGKLVDHRKSVHNFQSRVAQNSGIGH